MDFSANVRDTSVPDNAASPVINTSERIFPKNWIFGFWCMQCKEWEVLVMSVRESMINALFLP